MSPQSVFIYCVFHDSALHRIVFVALLVDVERVILETGNGTKIHRLGIAFDKANLQTQAGFERRASRMNLLSSCLLSLT